MKKSQKIIDKRQKKNQDKKKKRKNKGKLQSGQQREKGFIGVGGGRRKSGRTEGNP